MAMIRLALVLALLASPASAEIVERRPGIAVDATGGAVVDPTRNVLDLVRAESQRQDGLREALKELVANIVSAQDKLNMLRAERDRELLKAAADRLDSEAKLRAEFAAAIRDAETNRVNAIRLVDTQAVQVANERATATASALAKTVQDTAAVLSTQVAQAAEATRALVATTAAETNRNVQQRFDGVATQITGLSTRITTLEQSGAEGKGSARFQDPALAALSANVQKLIESRSVTTGAGEGRGEVIAWILAGLMALFAMVGAVATVIVVTRRKLAA